MTEYVAYYRVSTDRQGQSGLGLDAQKALVETFANGAPILASYVEIESGRKDDRPVLAEALAYAKATKATLLIAKLDRLARDVHFVSGLLKAGVPIKCADMPEANIMVLQMMAVMAEQEARMISDRTKAALVQSKARGKLLGSNNPVIKASILARGKASADQSYELIQSIPGHETMSANALAKALNDNGHKTIRGNEWTAKQVIRVLDKIKAAG
ncbi:recombinase family protein [Agrobacterium pusense]|uniref:recombinase family protein n=1 Tax=Agrobacterium pusense TaxID=648995 RepID=UPI0022B8A02F|nr:recombinase family protein [Agrobacterium pusense]MCZ7926166.1 recombinase family protein [Agrobacterium pusense]